MHILTLKQQQNKKSLTKSKSLKLKINSTKTQNQHIYTCTYLYIAPQCKRGRISTIPTDFSKFLPFFFVFLK